MASDKVVPSIVKLLTYPNPPVYQIQKKGKTNSRGGFLTPKMVIEWKDFKVKALKDIFGGRLLREAQREEKGRELRVPSIRADLECRVSSQEASTGRLIEKWCQTIVNNALDPIAAFQPAYWEQGDPPRGERMVAEPRREQPRVQPTRKSSEQARKRKKMSLRRIRPDSGAVSRTSDPKDHRQEKFPKEYKPAINWRSRQIFEKKVVDESGNWNDRMSKSGYAWPVRQAFTQCIQNMCRYGCLLSCDEAFIFRISTLDERPDDEGQDVRRQNPKAKDAGNEDAGKEEDEEVDHLLADSLSDNGLIEYVSIPWNKHYYHDETGENYEAGNHDGWTINLALWFLHVLAGISYKASWKYEDIDKEVLPATVLPEMPEEARPPTPDEEEDSDGGSEATLDNLWRDLNESNEPAHFIISPLAKRKRDLDEEVDNDDAYKLSFSDKRVLVGD